MWEKQYRDLFFVANFYENCPFLELYPKLSLSDRDILHSSHTAGAIWEYFIHLWYAVGLKSQKLQDFPFKTAISEKMGVF
jgi:hypothetical protein